MSRLTTVNSNYFEASNLNGTVVVTHIDYEKNPVHPDSTTTVNITYNADDIGHFNKTVSVYGNVENSPLIIRLKGNIEQ